MDNFKYTKQEKEINKVLKYNQEISQKLLDNSELLSARKATDDNINSSIELLKSLGYDKEVSAVQSEVQETAAEREIRHKPMVENWDSIVTEANEYIPYDVKIEDILSREEIDNVVQELDRINAEFSRKTSIVNKTDLKFLAVATALQVVKALLFPHVAEKFGYGKSFDPAERLAHNDKTIEEKHREANDRFRDKYVKKNGKGYWINILYQTPPYDITKGSAGLGINMEGRYHRLHTLGHDPILGWFFGTANILTDIITLNDFRSFRVVRKPKMEIIPKQVTIDVLLKESYQMAKDDYLNLPAAIFAQAQHLKSDVATKTGLPVPILSVFNENFASKLYKNQYDSLCLARDMKIIGVSYLISVLVDMIIGLTHGLFRQSDDSKELYEVRTRKILLISNSIASTSSIINACITKNPKNLDLGSLLSTVSHLFTDIRFITKIKQEFIQQEIDKKIQHELNEIEEIYNSMCTTS